MFLRRLTYYSGVLLCMPILLGAAGEGVQQERGRSNGMPPSRPGQAVEQGGRQILFQIGQMMTQGRYGDARVLGRPGQGAMFIYSGEIA